MELGARIGIEHPSREVHLGLGKGFRIGERGAFDVGIESVEVLAFRHQHLLPVQRHLVTLHVGEHGLGRVALVGDIHAGEISLGWHAVIALQPTQPFLSSVEIGVIAGRHGDLIQPGGQIGEVNFHGNGSRFLRLGRLAGLRFGRLIRLGLRRFVGLRFLRL